MFVLMPNKPAVGEKPRFFYGYAIVAAVFLSLGLAYGTYYSYGVFFKPMMSEFGWTRAETSGAYSLSFLLSGVLSVVMGRLNDRFGSRIVGVSLGLFMGLGFLLMSRVEAVWQLYVFWGVIIGLGMSGAFVPLLSTVVKWFPARKGLMTGIAISGIGIGTIVIPPAAGWMISAYDWRLSYIIVGSVVLVVIVAAAQLFRPPPVQIASPADSGITGVENTSIDSFSLREALRTRQPWMVCGIFGCGAFLNQLVLVHIVNHITDLGVPAATAAGVLSIIGGISIMGRLTIGSARDRIGNKRAYGVSFATMLAAYLWLQVARESWMLYLFAVIFGLAYGGLVVLISPLIADLFGLRAHGAIFGTANIAASGFGSLSPLLAGRIFDMTEGYYAAFWVGAGISIVGLVLALLLRPPVRREARMVVAR